MFSLHGSTALTSRQRLISQKRWAVGLCLGFSSGCIPHPTCYCSSTVLHLIWTPNQKLYNLLQCSKYHGNPFCLPEEWKVEATKWVDGWMGGWEIIIEYKHDTKNVQVSQVLGTGVPQCGNPYLDILVISYFKCQFTILRMDSLPNSWLYKLSRQAKFM